MKSKLAKLFGWAQSAVVVGINIYQVLHGLPINWAQLFVSLSTAVGVHHASNTEGTK